MVRSAVMGCGGGGGGGGGRWGGGWGGGVGGSGDERLITDPFSRS